MGTKIDFYRLFIVREGKDLAGSRIKNILSLVGILFITFLAIGFGEGGLDYLEIKMSDPFTHWVNVPVPYMKSDSIAGYIEELENESVKNQYRYSNVKAYSHYSQRFFDASGKQIQAEGRTIEPSNPLLKSILTDYKIQGISFDQVEGYFNDQSVGVIVSREFMNKLGYVNKYPPFLRLVYPVSNDTDLVVPLPVISVVKQLPGMVSLMTTQLFYAETHQPKVYMFLVNKPEYQKILSYFIPEGSDVSEWKSRLEKMVGSKWKGLEDGFAVEDYRKSFQQGKCIMLYIRDEYIDQGLTADIIDIDIQKSLELKENPLIRIYQYEYGRLDMEETGQDYLSVHMNSLDSITQFQQYVQDQMGLEIEMSQINAKSNYNFVSKLTLITSLILIVFSIIAVSLFLSSLIKSHFEKIKKNLGTFKAFGLDNRMLIITYSAISFVFVLSASLLAFLLAYLLGYLGVFRFIISGFGITLEKGYLYFNLLTGISLYTFLIIIVLSTLIVVYRLRLMLKFTPGDLIYER